MNKLSNYSNKEQDFIINLGLFNYKKTREFVENDEDFLKKWEKNEEKNEILSLKEKIFEIEKENNEFNNIELEPATFSDNFTPAYESF